MKESEEIWMNDVLNSCQGMQKANPADGLFNKILNGLNTPQAKIIQLPQIRIAAAAAAIVALLNMVAIQQYVFSSDNTTNIENESSLISNYNLYE